MNFNEEDFLKALDPNEWHVQETGLNTPTFTARIIPGTGLVLSRNVYSIEEAEALTRFLANNIDIEGVEAPGEFPLDSRFVPGMGIILATTTYSPDQAKILTRFLVDKVGVKPLEPADTDMSWFQPKKVEE